MNTKTSVQSLTSSNSEKPPIHWPLIGASLLTGLGCSVYWTYAITHLQEIQSLPSRMATAYWIILGVAGIAGGLAGSIIRRIGIQQAYITGVLILCLSMVIIPLSQPIWSFVSMIGFGAAYIFLTGLFVIWGISISRETLATQISRAFLALGLGQFVGSWLAGILVEQVGLNIVFLIFAAITLLALFCRPHAIRAS